MLPVLLTKVKLPQRRKDVLRRVRLVDSLHQNLHRKLMFVSAPAGYGKSTLLIDFASDVDTDVAWYSIGPDDNDLVSFAFHLVAAFQQIRPEFGQDIVDLLASSGGEIDPQALAAEFINGIQFQIEDFTILMLDDYQLVVENQQITAFIESLLEHLPDQIRLIIGSRSVFGIPTANLYVREDLHTLGAGELRFRSDELIALVQQNYHVKLDKSQADQLAERSDGWVVAILLSVRTIEHGGLPKFEGATDQVYSYLAREVVQHLPKGIQSFLMATSILVDFTVEQCDFILGSETAANMLSEIEGRNLFLTKIKTGEGSAYRYHHLFSDFLKNYFVQDNLSMKQQLHSRAAEWYHQQGNFDLAVNHALAGGDKKKAAQWMDSNANGYFLSGRQRILSNWYDQLEQEPDMRHVAPHFILDWAKVLVNQSDHGKAEQLLDISYPVLESVAEGDQIVNAMVIRGTIWLFKEKYPEALEIADRAISELKTRKLHKFGSFRRHQAERLKGMAHYYLGHSQESIKYLVGAVKGFRKLITNLDGNLRSQKSHDLAETLNDLGFVSYRSGKIDKAQNAFQEALEIRTLIKGNRGALALARNNVAFIYYLAGQYRQAWNQYAQALEDIQATQWTRVQVDILNGRADLLLALDDLSRAEKDYRTAIDLGNQTNEHINGLAESFRGMSRLALHIHGFNDAIHWLREAASHLGQSIDDIQYQLSLGEIYLRMGQNDLARDCLEPSLISLETQSLPSANQALGAFLLSQYYYEEAIFDKSQQWLANALRWAAMVGYDNFLILAGRQSREFLDHALEKWPNEQLSSIARRTANFTPGIEQFEKPEPDIESPIVHLDITGFGDGQVRRNGELITNSQWRSNRARSLFFYLLDKKTARKEDIAIEFWPDFSPAKVNSNFHATLWRVRNALGGNETIVYHDGYYFLHPEITWWYDVDEFQECVKILISERQEIPAHADLLNRTVSLYNGGFLNSLFMDWSEKRRIELQGEYILALEQLGQYQVSIGQLGNAKDNYTKILSLDPFRDEIHLQLMECLVASGSSRLALAHFDAYKHELKQELAVNPPQLLQSFADQLSETG